MLSKKSNNRQLQQIKLRKLQQSLRKKYNYKGPFILNENGFVVINFVEQNFPILDLPLEILREVVLSTADSKDFLSCMLAYQKFYSSLTKNDIYTQRVKFHGYPSVKNILRCYENALGDKSYDTVIRDGRPFYVGSLSDMIHKTETTFLFAGGSWEIHDYYDHTSCIYGFLKNLNEDERGRELTLALMNGRFGLAEKLCFDCVIMESALKDLREDNPDKTEEELVATFREDWDSEGEGLKFDETEFEGFIAFGRGEDYHMVYMTKNTKGLVTAFWIISESESENIGEVLLCL